MLTDVDELRKEETYMALVNCPECGKERVSDSAEACPECGFAVKLYYDKIRYEAEQKAQKELQIAREEKNQKAKARKKKYIINKLFGSSLKKIFWGFAVCGLACLCAFAGIYVHNENEISKAIEFSCDFINDLQDAIPQFHKYFDDFYYLQEPGCKPTLMEKEQMEGIENALIEINRDISLIDFECNHNERVRQTIDDYISSKSTFKSWEEYKQFIVKNYLVAETPQKSADYFIKLRTYNSLEELLAAKRSKSLFIQSHRGYIKGDYFIVSGTVKNNTSSTVSFVVVKIELIDRNGNVFDSDTTYAVGEEGISPGNSAKFECYLDNDINIARYSVSIFSYR